MAREGWPILGILALCAVVLVALFGLQTLVLTLPLLGFTAWFFRDPERLTPTDPRVLVSPADGQIIEAGPRRISVFMNVLNVHVCRAPAAGQVALLDHRPGRFLPAFRSEACEENERLTITLQDGQEALRFSLVAGLIARRIVCRLRVGQSVERGQRVGLIRFGSRVDLELPAGAQVQVARGQRVTAGETIVALL
jgi:phosphatidylserine decarboxylase